VYALYGVLAALFCAPLFAQPHALGISDWDQHFFYYGAVLQSALGYGQPPFWNPWYCGGNVLWGNPQVALLSPVYPLAMVTSLALAMKVNIFLHYWLGFIGMHLLLTRVIGLAFLPLFVYLGSVFTLSGAFALHLNAGHSNFLPAFYLPLILFFFLRSVATGKVRDALLGGAVLALTVYNGGPHILPVALVAVGALATFAASLQRRWQPIVVALLLSAAGLAYAAPKLSPVARFVTSDEFWDTRPVTEHPDRMTTAMLLRVYVDPYQVRSLQADEVQRHRWFEYGNYVGALAVILTFCGIIWTVATRNPTRRWLGFSIALTLILLVVLSAGEFSEIAPASLLTHLPLFSSFRIPSRYTVVVPLLGAMLIGWVLQMLAADRASGGLRLFVGLLCAAGVAQLLITNGAQLRGVFSVLPLEHGFRLPDGPETLRSEVFGPNASMLRALAGGRAVYDCYEPLQVRRTARAAQALASTDEGVKIFNTDFSPNRISMRIAGGSEPSRINLNQNFSTGWSSNVGPVSADPASGNPSVVIPPGYAGRVEFAYSPPGLWTGVVILFVASGASVLGWRQRIGAPGPSSWVELIPPRLRDRLAHVDAGLIAFLILVVAVHLLIYERYPYRPIAPNTGWENFWDQGNYLKSARALARGDLSPDQHWYPIGYSLLAAPFAYLFPRDPFVVVNAFCLLIFAGAFLIYFRPLIGSVSAAAAFMVALALPFSIKTPLPSDFPIWSQFVVPWNTVPIAAIYMCIFCLMRDLGSVGGTGRDLTLGALGASTLAFRPTDALALLPAGGVYLWHRLRGGRPGLHLGAALAGALAVLIPAVVLTRAIHGGLTTPYLEEARRIGMSLSDIHERAYAILFSSAVTFGEVDTALLELQPWLYVLFPLAMLWAARDVRRGFLPVLTAIVSLLVYLSFNDFWPFNFLRFFLIHYVVWLLPIVTASGIAGGLLLVRERRWKSGVLVAGAILIGACHRVEPRVLRPDAVRIDAEGPESTKYSLFFNGTHDLDAIDLVGASSPNAINLTVLRIKVLVDGEPLDLFSGYRMIQLNGGVRMIFNRHVSARHVEFDLGADLGRHPRSADLVKPVRFDGRFVPFWVPQTVARIV
jgi:hypothetical protein